MYDTLKLVQTAAWSCLIVCSKCKKDIQGTNAGLCSALAMKKLEVERDSSIANYECSQLALIALHFSSADKIPWMTVADTFHCSTFNACQLGDSHQTNSSLYTTPTSLKEPETDVELSKEVLPMTQASTQAFQWE